MSPRSRETEAIVLDCQDHGEADMIITFFCRDIGRISAIAKGAKRSLKRFVNKLEFFSFLHITYSELPNSSLFFLHQAELYASFLNLRKDIALYTTATTIRECILLAMREGERDENIFRLTLWALHNLDLKQPHFITLTLFLVKFYACIGYKPELHVCQNCGTPVATGREYGFNYLGGGVVCSNCPPFRHQTALRLSRGTLKILQSAQDLPLDRLHRLKFSGYILDECLIVLHHFGRHLFQREISSWGMLDSIRLKNRKPAGQVQR